MAVLPVLADDSRRARARPGDRTERAQVQKYHALFFSFTFTAVSEEERKRQMSGTLALLRYKD